MNAIQKCIKQLEKSHNMPIKDIDIMTKAMISYCEKHKSCMFVYDGFDISGRHINARIYFSPEVSQ
jgi:hypothetical protein